MNKNAAMWCLIICIACLTYKSKQIPPESYHYTVEFTGTSGATLYGVTGWTDTRTIPASFQNDKIGGALPVTVELDPPPRGMPTAIGMTNGQGDVIIKIYREGVECGEDVFDKDGNSTGSFCRPPEFITAN